MTDPINTSPDPAAELAQLKAELERAKSRIGMLEKVNDTLKKTNDELVRSLTVHTEFGNAVVNMVKDIREGYAALKTGEPNFDGELYEQYVNLRDFLFSQVATLEKYRKLSFAKGNERIVAASQNLKKLKQEILDADEAELRSLQKAQSMLNHQIGAIANGVNKLKGDLTDVQKALKNIANTKNPGKPKGKRGGKGRKPSRRNIQQEKAAANRSFHTLSMRENTGASDKGVCLHHNLENMGDVVTKCVQQVHAIQNNWKEVAAKCDVYRCRDCHRIIVKFPEEADVPVTPLRTLGVSVIAQTLHLLFNGMALNRIEDTFMSKLCLGSNTLYDNCWKWCELYGERMVRMIIDHAGEEASALIADGTPFDCLEGEGRGVVPEKNYADSVTSSQTYVMAVGTLPDISTPYTCYMPMKSRSAASIFEVLKQFPAKSITCDGYVGYSCLSAQNGKMSDVEFGCCNVHLRRECIEGAALPQFVNIRKTHPELNPDEFIVEQLQNDSPYLAMVGIIDAMSKISAIEESIPPQREDESRDAYEARVLQVRQEQEKPLYESIDQLFVAIAPKVAEETKTGKWKAKTTTPYTKAVLYYMNRRRKLQRFLENPRIPFSTNQIERAIRPMTMVRRALNFVQSSNGMKGICTAMSLFETARQNGIEDPVGWMMDFTKSMLKFCMEERMTELDAAGKLNLSRQIQQWQLDKQIARFDEPRFLPWNYRG